jgi:hypothetical protein
MLKTNQIMVRPFQDQEIRQRTSDSYFNATDLLTIYNKQKSEKKLMNNFLRSEPVNRFIEALADDLNKDSKYALKRIMPKDLYTTKKGKYGGTWMHPYLFMKFAMWINPVFEVQVIKWLYDNLINARHQAGDYYKEMGSAIRDYLLEKGINANPLAYKREADFINELVFGVAGFNQRKRSTEEQLKKLSQLQKANIRLLKANISTQERWNKLRDFSQLL